MNKKRKPNTNRHGKNFSKEEERQVWEKAPTPFLIDHQINSVKINVGQQFSLMSMEIHPLIMVGK